MTRSVQILAFDDMEVLDYAGPYEVFNVAGELGGAFAVSSVGVTASPRGRGGFAVVPSFTLAEAPAADIVVVPGGAGTRRLLQRPDLLDWVRVRAATAELVLTVCTGALVAGAAGLLDGLAATTHHGAFGELATVSPTTRVVTDQRFVRSSDRIRTSGGISAGIDLSLAIVEELEGVALREAVETEMEWRWHR